MDMLGNTSEQITNEKAGIIKDNTPVIIGKVNKIAKQVLKKAHGHR
jgi:folylpolyglutamate synthase/dihydropteroate synthase